MGYDLYRIYLVYSVVRTVAIPTLKSFLHCFDIHFNLSSPDTLGAKESGRCGEVAVSGGSTVVSAGGPVSR